jgi:hypothetical protein
MHLFSLNKQCCFIKFDFPGTLAGSTVLLLSLAWGGSLWLGRCDLNDKGTAIDKKLTPGKGWSDTGVTVDEDVRKGALIMAASVLLYGSVQIPAFLGASEAPLVSDTSVTRASDPRVTPG